MSLVAAENLSRRYRVRRGLVGRTELRALDGVSFALEPGRTLAVAGESGCGKSTLARLVSMVEPPSAGRRRSAGVDVAGVDAATRRRLRPQVQMVFQDPYGSLNPRKTVGAILEEPLAIQGGRSAGERRAAAAAMMRRVGLRPELADRYPHMFSGGQRQRIAIARALMPGPRVLVADEPVSALDVSIQAQVLNLLLDLQDEFGLAYLFISHDLAVVRHLADEVMIMYLGRVVEHGPAAAVLEAPRHPYTIGLRAATPKVGVGRREPGPALEGELPSPFDPPPGCAFHRRCAFATAECARDTPVLRDVAGRLVACHHAERVGG